MALLSIEASRETPDQGKRSFRITLGHSFIALLSMLVMYFAQ